MQNQQKKEISEAFVVHTSQDGNSRISSNLSGLKFIACQNKQQFHVKSESVRIALKFTHLVHVKYEEKENS